MILLLAVTVSAQSCDDDRDCRSSVAFRCASTLFDTTNIIEQAYCDGANKSHSGVCDFRQAFTCPKGNVCSEGKCVLKADAPAKSTTSSASTSTTTISTPADKGTPPPEDVTRNECTVDTDCDAIDAPACLSDTRARHSVCAKVGKSRECTRLLVDCSKNSKPGLCEASKCAVPEPKPEVIAVAVTEDNESAEDTEVGTEKTDDESPMDQEAGFFSRMWTGLLSWVGV
jgi:hypothetical protein